MAQGVETNDIDLRVVGGRVATMPDNINFSFVAQRLVSGEWRYPRVLTIANSGRTGIGRALSEIYGSRSMLSVGSGAYSVSADDAGSVRYNDGLQADNYVAGGGACIGFNASRQSDAAYACEPGLLDAKIPASGSRNGGALIWADVLGGLNFTCLPSSNGNAVNVSTTNYFYASQVQTYRVMKIKASNQVQIGLTAPSAPVHADYRLAVDGKLVAKSIFVTQAPNWADFVFEPTYALQSLPELEAYVKQNRHLPAIPSAAEVEKNGVDLGDINARLLQSLEELTLHVIELGKQNTRLQAEVAALADKVNQADTAPVVGK